MQITRDAFPRHRACNQIISASVGSRRVQSLPVELNIVATAEGTRTLAGINGNFTSVNKKSQISNVDNWSETCRRHLLLRNSKPPVLFDTDLYTLLSCTAPLIL